MSRAVMFVAILLALAGLFHSCATTGTGSISPKVSSADVIPGPEPVPLKPANLEPVPGIVPPKKAVSKEIVVQVPKLAREEVRYPDGSLNQLTVITYDAKGNPVKEELFNRKKTLIFARNYQISADGLTQTITTVTQSGEIQGIEIRNHDSRNQLVKETLLDARKKVQSVAEYTWAPDGSPLTWISRNQANEVVIATNYRVIDGKVVGIELLDEKGNPIRIFDQTWNPQGQLVRKTERDPLSGSASVITYEYAGKLLVREAYSRADGTPVRAIEYSHDGQGVPNELRFLDRRGNITEIRKQEYRLFSHTETITVFE